MSRFIKIIQEEIENLKESSLSRIYHHMQGEESFAIMSPHRKSLSPEENFNRYNELKQSIRDAGLGFIELKGGYLETQEDTGAKIMVNEDSLLIPRIGLKFAIQLGQKYDQDGIMYKPQGGDEIFEVSTNNRTGREIGQVISKFNPEFDFSPDTLSFVYSKPKKGSHSDKKFAFQYKG